jgi:hypothetical protein
VNVGLHCGGVDAKLAAAGHLQRSGELDDPVVDPLDGLGPDGVGPGISAFRMDAAIGSMSSTAICWPKSGRPWPSTAG